MIQWFLIIKETLDCDFSLKISVRDILFLLFLLKNLFKIRNLALY